MKFGIVKYESYERWKNPPPQPQKIDMFWKEVPNNRNTPIADNTTIEIYEREDNFNKK